MGEQEPQAIATAPRRRSFLRTWGWRIALCFLILVGIAGYYTHRRGQVAGFVILPDTGEDSGFRPVTYLPRLGGLATFRQDQEPARVICRRLGLPELPDISSIDATGQEQFYVAFKNIRLRPKAHDQYGRLGQLYEAQKFPELAIQLYRRAIRMEPDDYEWHYALALRLVNDGEIQAATAEFRRAGELNPKYAPVWMRLCWRAVEEGEWPQAVDFANRYIELRPQDPFGYVERAALYHDQQDWERMQQDLEKAKALGPIGKRGHRFFGILCRHLNRPGDSQFHLRMSKESQSGGEMEDEILAMMRNLETSRDPMLSKFNTFFATQRYKEAVELADKVLQEAAGRSVYGELCGQISVAYAKLRDFRQALHYAELARREMPDSPAPYTQLALLYLETRRYGDALVEAEKALEIDPRFHSARYVRGRARVESAAGEASLPPELREADPLSLVRQGLEDLKQACAEKPVNHLYLKELGRAHGMLGDYKEADRALTVAVQVLEFQHLDNPDILALKRKAETRRSFWPDGVELTVEGQPESRP